jgi:phosphomannomutase
MSNRILSISGLRGVIGDGLDPVYITQFAAALGTMFRGGRVILSRDGRSTGEMVRHAVVSGLLATGCEVLDAGICTTPTCGVLVRHHDAVGGLQITASHNPVQWNGLKPFSADGSVFNADLGRQLLDLLAGPTAQWTSHSDLGTLVQLPSSSAVHIERVLSLVDTQRIRERRFRVVLDCNHGSGGVCGPQLLEALGCDVVTLGGTPDGKFAHPPEPLAKNLGGLCDAVREHQADAGFAQDPDADRLAIVDNQGRYIGEELTLALAADFVLQNRQGAVVVNESTSRVTADIAARYGCEFHRSFVGEANVCAEMRRVNAVLGGEGNGGVIEPAVGYVRDSLVSMAYVLAGLVEKSTSLSEWSDSLPQYVIVKDSLTCPASAVPAACEALRKRFADATAKDGDGLRLDWNDRWLHVRSSNTEPIVRVIAEAPEEASASTLVRDARAIVEACLDPAG